MTFHDFENITSDMMAYFGHNFSDTYWDMGGGKTIGNRKNTYESYRSSYNPVKEHHWEIDSDFDKTGRFDEFTHKYFCGDQVILDLSNEKLEEVRLLKRNHAFNGMITTIKKCIPRKTKYDEPRYEIDIRNFDDSISQIYTVPESMLLKIGSKTEPKVPTATLHPYGNVTIDDLTGSVELNTCSLPSFDYDFPKTDISDLTTNLDDIVHNVSQIESRTTTVETTIDDIYNEQKRNFEELDSRLKTVECTANEAYIKSNDLQHSLRCSDTANSSGISDIEILKYKTNSLGERIDKIENTGKRTKKLALLSFLGKILG
jgi:hypothetical protein